MYFVQRTALPRLGPGGGVLVLDSHSLNISEVIHTMCREPLSVTKHLKMPHHVFRQIPIELSSAESLLHSQKIDLSVTECSDTP